jgi:hypothetical protein
VLSNSTASPPKEFIIQENGLLVDPLDPMHVAALLREFSRLEKKMIGDYICNGKSINVLEAFDFLSIFTASASMKP